MAEARACLVAVLLLAPAATEALPAPSEPEVELPGLLLLPDGLARPAAAAVLSLALVLGVLEPDSACGLAAAPGLLLPLGLWVLALLLCGKSDTTPLLRDPA
jgi:hypothetical protein